MLLEIDYREREILESLNGDDLKFTSKNLFIGDFIFKNDNDEIILIVERKTFKDLCASIIDSRFREQKERLLESVPDPSKILYILEGSKRNLKGKGSLSKTIMDSAVQNLLFKHQFKVLFTESLDDTVDQLKMLYNKLYKKMSEMNCSSVIETMLIKKSTKIIDNIYINQLSVIPGVSVGIARKISDHYPSLFDLIKAYMQSESPESLLTNIQVTDKRKLGKCLSKKIYECLNNKQQPQVQQPQGQQCSSESVESGVESVESGAINVKSDCVL